MNLDRNNTSFIKELTEQLKHIQYDESDALKYYQRVTHDYVLESNVRGVLAYYEMGAGKSILAASILVSAIDKGGVRKILFISGKSLHANMRTNIKKYLELSKKEMSESDIEEYIDVNFRFISLNASNMLKQVYRTTVTNEDALNESFDEYLEPEDEQTNSKQILEEISKLDLLGNLDDTFVVVDEAHNFFNSITNGSKNAVGLYYLIMHAKNIKLLFLTGSPIVNDPYEIAMCYNMLAGYLPGKHTLFGEDYQEFIKYFIDTPAQLDLNTSLKPGNVEPVLIKNADKFTNRIVGLTSHYSTKIGEIQKLFPTLYEPIIERIPMSAKQYIAYSRARDKESEEAKRSAYKSKSSGVGKPQGSTSSYRVRSRQFSNFIYPSYASNNYKDAKGFNRYEVFINKLTESTFKYHNPSDKNDGEDEMGLETWSPKLCRMLMNLSRHLPDPMLQSWRTLDQKQNKNNKSKDKSDKDIIKLDKNKSKVKSKKGKDMRSMRNKDGKAEYGVGPGIVYSQFIDAGIGLLAKALGYHGFVEIKSVADLLTKTQTVGRYAIISGEVDPELRSEILKIFVSKENIGGDILALLLITSTGAEGLDTKYVRHVHVMEPFWHWSRIAQVFARGARLGSHLDLPIADRNVQPYIYLSDYPLQFESEDQAKIKAIEDTTDVTLYLRALQNQILIDSFLSPIKQACIDCLIHYSKGPCKICHPTNEPLFIADLVRDMRISSPCSPIKEEKIKAKSVIVETVVDDIKTKQEYMYSGIDNKLHIFMHDSKLNGYIEISEYDPEYDVIVNKIKKIKSKK